MSAASTYIISAFQTFFLARDVEVEGPGPWAGKKLIYNQGNFLPHDGTKKHENYDQKLGSMSEWVYRSYILYVYVRQFQLLKEKI